MDISILHISSSKNWRGGEQQLAYLIEELLKKEIKQWVLCVRGSAMEQYCEKYQIPFFVFRKFFSGNPFPALQIQKICKQNNISILHVHDSHALTYGVFASHLLPIKIIISRRVDFPINSKWKYNHFSVKKILCVSGFVKQVIKKDIQKKGIIDIVHDGIDAEKFKYDNKNILRKEFKIPAEVPIVANIAAIAPHKDYTTFVRTAEILVKENIKVKFLIIGKDDGEKTKIERLIRVKNLENQIYFTGFRNDIPQILPELNLLLFTSKTEGLGTTILDAFACGIPVVATRAGGIPEIVENKKTGLLANIGNAPDLAKNVKKVLKNGHLRKQIIENAIEHVKNFSKKRMAEKTLEAYIEVSKLK